MSLFQRFCCSNYPNFFDENKKRNFVRNQHTKQSYQIIILQYNKLHEQSCHKSTTNNVV